MPRVVIGSPLFNHADHVREAVESILNQTFRDFSLILVDDCSTDATPEIVREYEALDSRVSYHRNEQRLGLVGNSRQAFRLARARHPDAEYFAWASDHDLCHPGWLRALVDALDAHPAAVLAYPMNRRIGPSGEVLKRKPWRFDTDGIANRWTRLRLSIRHMRAGNMVYGLYRVATLERAGVYRSVVVPDRLLCAELSLYGSFKQVTQVLWFRRWFGRVFSLDRQRANFFIGRRPFSAYLPWWISHAASLGATFAIRGEGRPDISRVAGVYAAAQYLVLGSAAHVSQTLHDGLAWLEEQMSARRQHLRRVRRAMARQGVAHWVVAHLREAWRS
jgi:glycosyltransferase involved in cell wall biosynthesis